VSDPDLFAAGAGITLLFLGGVFIVVRERFLHSGKTTTGTSSRRKRHAWNDAQLLPYAL
jgi:hypothetical protein